VYGTKFRKLSTRAPRNSKFQVNFTDINGDGVVDGQDVQLVKNAMPSMPSSDNYNSQADVNNDGVVDGADYQLVKKRIRKSC